MSIAAGVLAIFAGLGFGIPAIFGMRHLRETGEVWMFLGYPTYGGGPFERLGIQPSIPLLFTFLLVCVVEVVLGVMLLTGTSYARTLSLALLPFEFAFWIGFALPAGPPLGIVRVILLALS